MATANKKRSAAAADKAPEEAQPDQAQHEAVNAQRKFGSADELAHFIHHNPEFGALPLQEQDTLRGQLVTAKRAEAEQDGYWPDGRKRLTLTEGDALADLNGTPRPDNHED
ncbi:hypothetical protein [Comamonas aquatica]|uniref:hypothetical protein n=1 Tax=Comamonas aquatica TaxID=225991 RepID=UPI0034D61561